MDDFRVENEGTAVLAGMWAVATVVQNNFYTLIKILSIHKTKEEAEKEKEEHWEKEISTKLYVGLIEKKNN